MSMSDSPKPSAPARDDSVMDRLLGWLPPFCLAVSLFLSCYTTHYGISEIIQNEVAAFAFTIVVQLLLVFCSWNLGKMIGRFIVEGRGEANSPGRLATATRHAFFWTTFGIAFSVSVFFSFSYYFNQIFSKEGQQLVQESLPNEVIAAIAPGLRKDVVLAERNESRTVLEGEPTVWLNEVGTVVQLAKDNQGAITGIFDERRQAREERERQAREQREVAQTARRLEREETRETLQTSQRRQAELQFKVKQLEDQIKPLEAEKAELESDRVPLDARRAQAQAEADKERLGVEGRERGKGPEYRKAMEALAQAERDLAYYNERMAKVDARLRETRGAIASLQAELATLPAEIRRLESSLGTTPELTPAAISAPAPDTPAALQIGTLEGFIRETERLGTAFRAAPGRQSYVALSNACQQLVEPLAAIGKAGGNDCRSDAAFQELVAYDERRPLLIAARGKFQDQCSEVQTRAFIQEVAAGAGGNEPFNRAVDLLRGCVQLASAAGANAAGWQTTLTEFVKQNSLERDRFSITLDAPSLGPSQFVIGILMSFAQDMLILSLGVFWEIERQEKRRTVQRRRPKIRLDVAEKEDDPPQVVAMKAVLRLIESEKADRSLIVTKSYNPDWDALPQAVRSNATALLNQLVRERLARSTEAGFVITPIGVRELEAELAAPSADSGAERQAAYAGTPDGRRRPRPTLLRT